MAFKFWLLVLIVLISGLTDLGLGVWDRHYNVVSDILLELRWFLLGCGVNDFQHVMSRILADFIQMVYFSRQFARYGDPEVLVHVDHDNGRVSISHTGASYTHQEIYEFLGRQVLYFNFCFLLKSSFKILSFVTF